MFPQQDFDYIVAIGTSTGGPKALQTVVRQLPGHLSATYVVVQHMPKGFTKSLAERLNTVGEITVKEAEDGEVLKRGCMYIAPGGKQFKVSQTSPLKVILTDEPPYKAHKPSVNVLFNSLAEAHIDKKIIAVIMTGMGNDGLEGTTHLVQKKKTHVIAQDQESCVVYGMPKAIVNEKLTKNSVPLDSISRAIQKEMGGTGYGYEPIS